MSKDIDTARLKASIEFDASKMKKGAESAKQIARSTTSSINKEFDKVKDPLSSVKTGNSSLAFVKNLQKKLKQSMASITPSNLYNGFKDKKKQFQLNAGIKVRSDEFLEVENDVKKTEKALQKLRLEEEALRDMNADQGMSAKYRKVSKAADEAEKTLDKLLRKQKELEASGDGFVFTPKYQGLYDSRSAMERQLKEMKKEAADNNGMVLKEIDGKHVLADAQKEIAQTEQSLKQLNAEMEKLETKGKMLQPSKAMEKLNEQIESARDKLGKYKTEMTDLTAEGLENGTEEWIKNQKAIEKCSLELEKYGQMKENLEKSGRDVAKPVSFGRQAPNFGSSAFSFGRNAATKGWGGITRMLGGLQSTFTKVTEVIKKTSGVFGALIQKFTSGIPVLNRTKSSFNGLSTSGSGLNGILKTIGMTAKFMFASFVIRGALDGAKEGFQNLAQYSDRTNQSISAMMSSLTQLKNALAAAFAPILNVVSPILDALIQKIISVVNVIGQLTSALTGSSTYIRAKKVNQDYAASLDRNASSADDANEANKELQKTLLGFDQINKLDDGSYSNSDTGTGSNIGGLSPDDMFETVRIKSSIKGFADTIRSYIKAEDWEGLGKEIAIQLNRGLQHIYDVINWNNAGPRITYFVNAFTRTLNSLVDNINWDLMGRTAGAGVNTLVNTLNQLVEGIDFKNIGTKLSEGMRGAVAEIEWTNLGNLLGNKFMIMWNMLNGFVTDMSRQDDAGLTGWEELGVALGNAVNGIFERVDFATIGASLANGFNGVFEALKNFVLTVKWDDISANISNGLNAMIHGTNWAAAGESLSLFVTELLGTFAKAAKNTDWEGFGRGIGDFLANIDWLTIIGQVGTIIWEVFSGVLSGLFDTSSGKVILGFGAGILAIKGLFKVTDLALTIGQWVTGGTSKFSLLSTAASGLVSTIGPVLSSIGSVIFSPTGILIAGVAAGAALIVTHWDEIKEAAGEVSDWVGEKWESLKETTSEVWGNITTFLGETWDGLKTTAFEAFGKVTGTISDTWDSIKTTASEKWDDIKETVGETWENLTETATEKFEAIRTTVTDSWEEIKTTGGEVWGNVKETVGGIWEDLSGAASEKFASMKKSVSDAWDSASKSAGNVWGSVKTTVSGVWDWLLGKSEDDFSGIEQNIGGAWDNSRRSTEDNWGNAESYVTDALKNMDTETLNKMSSINNAVETKMGSVSSYMLSAWHEIDRKTYAALGNMAINVGSSLSKVKDKFEDLKESVSGSMSDMSAGMESAMSSSVNTLTNMVTTNA